MKAAMRDVTAGSIEGAPKHRPAAHGFIMHWQMHAWPC